MLGTAAWPRKNKNGIWSHNKQPSVPTWSSHNKLMKQSMPSPSPRISRADGILDLDSSTWSKVMFTWNNVPGDNFCYIDSVLVYLFFDTLPGSVSSPVTAQYVEISRQSCHTIRSIFLDSGCGMMDNERPNHQSEDSTGECPVQNFEVFQSSLIQGEILQGKWDSKNWYRQRWYRRTLIIHFQVINLKTRSIHLSHLQNKKNWSGFTKRIQKRKRLRKQRTSVGWTTLVGKISHPSHRWCMCHVTQSSVLTTDLVPPPPDSF